MGECTGEMVISFIHFIPLHICRLPSLLPQLLRLILCVCCQVCDLAQALRDGVLLCQLLNNLLPQAVNLREINLRPQMSQVTHAHGETGCSLFP